MAETVQTRPAELPVGPTGDKGIGWNGMVLLIVSEAALFVYLLFSYYYIGASATEPWVLEAHPSLRLAGPNTLILLLSSLAVAWGDRALRHNRPRTAAAGAAAGLVLGSAFAIIQVVEWKAKTFGLATSSFASLYYVTTGFHMAHVLFGLGVLAVTALWSWLGYFDADRRIVYSNASYYWHFVDAVWLLVFLTYYITPYLGFGR